MAGILKIWDIGALGVNVDADPISLQDQELTKAQNAIRDPLGSARGLRKRPGLALFNTTTALGAILGGIVLPVGSLLSSQTVTCYIGRGPKS